MLTWICCLLLGATGDTPFENWTPQSGPAALPSSVGQRLTGQQLEALRGQSPKLPYDTLTVGLKLDDGTLWVGTKQGLLHLASGAKRWDVFHSQTWLPGREIQNLAAQADGSIVAQTPEGIGTLRAERMTLDEKMAKVDANLRKMHIRDGQVGDIALSVAGKPEAGYFQPSSDNDGLWTSIYVGAEAFRYGATGDPQAKKNALESLRALMFMQDVTEIPGFAARSFVPISDDAAHYGGEWHKSKDGKWWWKGDTSSDELDGHYFAFAVCYDLVANDEEKAEIRKYVKAMTDHLIDNHWYYVGATGKPTTWGVFAPEKLNHDLYWLDDRGLNSLEILSHLKVAAHVVGDSRYEQAARELIDKHAYEINTVEQKLVWPPQAVNHSDDELAFLAYFPLLIYERDEHLREVYLASLERSWRIERPEHSPFLNFIYAVCRQASDWTDPTKRPTTAGIKPGQYDRDECIEWFRQVPIDTTIWEVKNSDRLDIDGGGENRFNQRRSKTVLPVSERRVMRWNGDPYELDGGAGGRARDDGAFILLPYWMGSYYRLLD